MQNNFIRNLLDLKGVIVKKDRYKKNFVKIHIEMPVREQTCPCCKANLVKKRKNNLNIQENYYFQGTKI